MSVKVIVQPNPFSSEKEIIEYDSVDYTIQELFDLQKIDIPIEQCIIILNDTEITENYAEIKPYIDDTLIIKVLPAGRDGWKIATMIGVGALVIGIGIATGGMSWGLMAAASQAAWIAGGIFDYVSPPEGLNVDPTYSMQGKLNAQEQYQIVPVVYGTTKLTPSYGGNDYTDNVDTTERLSATSQETPQIFKQNQYLHQLYVIGYEPSVVNMIQLGDTTLAERVYEEKTVTIQATQNTITGSGFNTTMIKAGSRVLIQGGLNEGEYQVESATYTVITLKDTYTLQTETATITLSYLQKTGIYTDVDISFGYNGAMPKHYPYQVTQTSLNKNCTYDIPQYYTTSMNVKHADIELGLLQGIGKINSNSKIVGKQVDFTIEYKLKTDTTWTTAYTDFIRGGTRKSVRTAYTIDFPVRGQYDIKITKTNIDHLDAAYLENLTWTNIRTQQVDTENNYITPIDADTASTLVIMALRIKASEQLSGTINNLNVVVSRFAKDYDSDTDTWIVRETNNPASLFVEALTNESLTQHPIPFTEEYFDMPSIKAFHTWCETEGYTCNGVCSTETTLEQELTLICGTARATFAVIDGKYTILPEIERPNPIQMFTARNMIKDSFSVSRVLGELPDGVTVQFINANVGYKVDTITASDSDNPTNAETIEIAYVDNVIQAYNLARYFFNSMQIQQRIFNFTTSMDALVATRGDKILVQHDAALLGLCSGRVSNYTVDSGLITQLIVDEACTMEAGKEYGILIRTEDDFVTYKLITYEGTTNTLYLDQTVVEDEILIGDLFSFGEYNLETSECVITSIGYNANLECTIEAIEYDSAVYNLAEMPVWSSGITSLGSDAPYVNTSTYGDIDATLQSIIERQNNSTNIKVFQEQPSPPYFLGDIWLNNTRLYDCVIEKEEGETYSVADWRLRSSSTFDVLNKDTFNIENPEHRWQQIPGDGVPYNLLASTTYEASSGEATKANILVNDGVDWQSINSLSAIQVNASGASHIITKSNGITAFVGGRYTNNGYMGESYTNKVTSPVTQDITVTGHVVVQTYRGTVSCSYGTASYNTPLEFDTSGETLTFTMTDAQYVSITETDFIPPYVNGTFTAHYDTQTVDGSLTVSVKVVNIPIDDTYPICHIYGDTDNYIDLALKDNALLLSGKASGSSFMDYIAISAGQHTFSLNWGTGVALSINGNPTDYTVLENAYGWEDNVYEYSFYEEYGFSGDPIVFSSTLTTAYLGYDGEHYFNNTFIEATV